MPPLQLLLETQTAAREVAFMLRCQYDGCTMVMVPSTHDTFALRTAIELTGASFCFVGDYEPLPLPGEDLTEFNSEQRVEHPDPKEG